MLEKYRLGNVVWFYNLENKKVVPIYISSDKTKAKDLKTTKTYKLTNNFVNVLAKDYDCNTMDSMQSEKIVNLCFNKFMVMHIAKVYVDYGRPSKEEIDEAKYSIYAIRKLSDAIETKFYDVMKQTEKEF